MSYEAFFPVRQHNQQPPEDHYRQLKSKVMSNQTQGYFPDILGHQLAYLEWYHQQHYH